MGRLNKTGSIFFGLLLLGIVTYAVAQEAGHHPNRVYIGQDGNLYINGASVYNDANADISASLEVLNSLTATELGYGDALTLGTVAASKTVTADASGNVTGFNDVGLVDDGEVQLGSATGGDVNLLWSDADSSNHAYVIGIGDTSQQIHITDKGAKATDWTRSAGTHPELAIHSNTTPTTDYLAVGNHDGTTATMDVVGGTTLNLDIAGTTAVDIAAAQLGVPVDDGFLSLGASDDLQILWSDGDATNHSSVIALDDTGQQIHITDVAAKATDWDRTAGTHPEVSIHSNTTPATDYLSVGNHDGTTATVDVVGGTTLNLDIAGTTAVDVAAAQLGIPVDDGFLSLGASDDFQMLFSDGDASDHATVFALDDTSQQLHVTDVAAKATDWARTAGTHPEVSIHSNTTPASDYLAIGNHDGTTATVDVVGGTTLNLDIAGTTAVDIAAAQLGVPVDDGFLSLGASDDLQILFSDGDSTNHSSVIALDDTGQQLHITDVGAKATDWVRSAGTHPELAIHSNTTPASDYLAIGNHDGTNASINMVGGTGLDVAIDGVGALRVDDAAVASFAGATDTVGQDVYLETQDAGGTATAARVGGLLNIKTGDGSDGAVAVIAGAGGAAVLTTGAGGGASGTAAGGAGGALTLSSAAGGAHTGGGGSGVGGAGGALAVTGGAGGATSNVGSDNGGDGGDVTITAGVGGLASAGTGDGGPGGDITLTPGSGGTGTLAGVPGKINITTGVVHFAVQTLAMGDAAVTLTLVPGTPVGTLLTGNILYADAESSGNENLLLPHEADSTGIFLIVINTGGETINLQDDAGGGVLTIDTTENGFVTCDGTTWMGSTGVL